jgi:hypothetical protein
MGELIVNMFMSLDGVALKLYAGELLREDRYADWAPPRPGRMTPRPGTDQNW